jgi:Mn2+/Fe2+ NRAMP family transporter
MSATAAGHPNDPRFLFFSSLLGRPVVGSDGQPVGRLADLLAATGEAYPPIDGIVVRAGRGRRLQLPVVAGCIVTDLVAFAIVVACAATLYKAGVKVETADQAALALAPLAGKYASWLFAFGLFNASFFAAAILPLSTAYYVCEAFGWESGIDRTYGEAKQFYWLYSSIRAIGALVVLIPKLPLVRIMLVSQIVNGVLLPFILVFMLILINREKLMGEYRNGRWLNAIAWATTLVMIALTVYLVIAGVKDLLA